MSRALLCIVFSIGQMINFHPAYFIFEADADDSLMQTCPKCCYVV